MADVRSLESVLATSLQLCHQAHAYLEQGNWAKFLAQTSKLYGNFGDREELDKPFIAAFLRKVWSKNPPQNLSQRIAFVELTAKIYCRAAKTGEHAEINALYSEIQFFKECCPGLSAPEDDACNDSNECADPALLIALMERAKIGATSSVQKILNHKIMQMNALGEHRISDEIITKAAVHHILCYTGLPKIAVIKRHYKTRSAFFHIRPARADSLIIADLQAKDGGLDDSNANYFRQSGYQSLGLIGDPLKAKIISDFLTRVSSAKGEANVDTVYEYFKKTPQYKILQKGQGLTTLFLHVFFNKKTDSVKAIEKIYNECKNHYQWMNTELKRCTGETVKYPCYGDKKFG